MMGPLSDRFGRRPVLICGIALYALASFVGALAPNLFILNLMRALQAIGCCCAVVCGRAIVRDLFEPEIGARLFAKVLTYMGAVALVCPLLGGALLTRWGWHAAFICMGLYAVLALLLTHTTLFETNQFMNPRATQWRNLLSIYQQIASHRVFWGFTIISTGSYSGLIVFFPNSSAVLMKGHGLSAVEYGLMMGLCTIGFILGTIACRRLLARFGTIETLRATSIGTMSAALTLLAISLSHSASPATLIGTQVAFMFCHGILQPIAQSAAVAAFPKTAGAAAALLGFFIHVGAAICLTVLSTTAPYLAWPLGLLWACLCVLFGTWVVLQRGDGLRASSKP
jgi:MFS transporter, DHA1 family, multidrug resistance protein